MPALQPVPKVLKVIFTTTDQSDQRASNRFFLQYSGTAPTITQLDAYATSLLASMFTHFNALYDAHTTFAECQITDLTSPTAAQGFAVSTEAGSRTGVPNAAGVGLVLDFQILRRYRGGKPKVWLSAGVAGDLNTRQLWGGTFAGLVQAAWVALITDASSDVWTGGGTIQQVNVSYFQGFTNHTYPSGRTRPIPTPRATPLVDVVVNVAANLKVGSQRRRNLQST